MSDVSGHVNLLVRSAKILLSVAEKGKIVARPTTLTAGFPGTLTGNVQPVSGSTARTCGASVIYWSSNFRTS